MIRFENVSKIYDPNTVALQDISFAIEKGEFVSVVGKSGAGKTTLLRLLIAEEHPSKGHVLFQEQNVHQIPPHKLPQLRRKIGMVFQDYKLLERKTAQENVAYIMEVLGAHKDEIEHDTKEVLGLVGLGDRAHHFPDELSGGEKQRVAIARALIHRPHVIIADEPTGNLDPYHTREIINLLLKINELGTTTILSTHNKEVVDKLGKRVITLEKGKIVRDQPRGKFII